MRLQDYISIIRKRWWIIVLVPLIAAVAAYLFSLLQTPLFRVRSEWSVGINRIDSGVAIGGADRVLANYRNLVYNPDKLQSISDQLGLDQTGTAMMRFVALQSQPSEMKFVIEVEYYTVDDAQRIAYAVGDTLNSVVVESNRNATGQDRLSLQRTISPTFVSYSPNKKINVLAGAILGLVLGAILAFALEYLDDTIKSAGDVERYTELVTVGSIPGGAAQGGRRSRLRPAAASGIIAHPTHNRNDHDR